MPHPEKQAASSPRRIPLFPLGLVLLPGMSLPLHIFEERYKQMIADCLTEDRPFGIIMYDGNSIREAGCTARVVSVTKRYGDGRMDITVRGEERFVVQDILDENVYLEGVVMYYDDVDAPSDSRTAANAATARSLLEELDAIDALTDSTSLAGSTDPKHMSFVIPALDGFTPAERQGFLEMTSCSERLEKAVKSLAEIVHRHRLTRKIQGIIGGNGHLKRDLAMQLHQEMNKET
jgi:ATP-dependent Lon protease